MASSNLPKPLTLANVASRMAAPPIIGAALAMPMAIAASAPPGSTIGFGGDTGSNVELSIVSASYALITAAAWSHIRT